MPWLAVHFAFFFLSSFWEGAALWPVITTFKKLFKVNMLRQNIPCGTLRYTAIRPYTHAQSGF